MTKAIKLNQEEILEIVKQALARDLDYRQIPSSARISGVPGKDLCLTCTLSGDQNLYADDSPAPPPDRKDRKERKLAGNRVIDI